MRTRTRMKNLPCHNSQAKSSLHGPALSGKPWLLVRYCSYMCNNPPPPFNPRPGGPAKEVNPGIRLAGGRGTPVFFWLGGGRGGAGGGGGRGDAGAGGGKPRSVR